MIQTQNGRYSFPVWPFINFSFLPPITSCPRLIYLSAGPRASSSSIAFAAGTKFRSQSAILLFETYSYNRVCRPSTKFSSCSPNQYAVVALDLGVFLSYPVVALFLAKTAGLPLRLHSLLITNTQINVVDDAVNNFNTGLLYSKAEAGPNIFAHFIQKYNHQRTLRV